MKQYLAKVSVLVVAMFALTACPKKGSNAPAPGAGAVGAYGAGVCATGVQTAACTPYYGVGGKWQGTMTIQNMAQYNIMMQQQGVVAIPQTIVGLSISLSQQQGRSRFIVHQAYYGQWTQAINKNGQAFQTNVGGFSIVSQNYYFGGGFTTLPYPNPNILPPQVNTNIEVAGQYLDASQRVIDASLSYGGVVVATGQLQGTPNYYGGGYGYQSAPAVVRPGRYY